MTTTNLILIGVAVVAIFGALGAFAIAFRRTSRDTTPDWESRVERDAREADQSLRGVRVEPVAVAEPEPAVEAVEPVTAEPDAAPDAETEPEREPVGVGVAVVEAQRVVEVSPEEAGVTRRQFFNRALGATFGLWGAGLGLGFLAFFWPRVSGGFGASTQAAKKRSESRWLRNKSRPCGLAASRRHSSLLRGNQPIRALMTDRL